MHEIERMTQEEGDRLNELSLCFLMC